MFPAATAAHPPSDQAASHDHPPAAVARSFLSAVMAQDFHRLAQLLADDVWTRLLMPRRLVEHHAPDALLDDLHEWFGTAVEIKPAGAAHHTVAGREHVRYRFLLRPEWEPDVWHLIEQVGHVRVADGRIRRVDLVCTGFHPVGADGPWA